MGLTDQVRTGEPVPIEEIAFDEAPARGRRFVRAAEAVVAAPPRPQDAYVPAAAEPAETTVLALERRRVVAIAAADLVAVLVALAVTLALSPTAAAQPATLVALAVALVAAKIVGLYGRDAAVIRPTTLDEAPAIAAATGLFALVCWLLGTWTVDGALAPRDVALLWASSAVLVLAGRTLARRAERSTTPVERILFVGDEPTYSRLRRALERAGSPTELVARLPAERIAYETLEHAVSVNVRALSGMVRWFGAQRVVVSSDAIETATMLDLLRAIKGLGVRVSLFEPMLEATGHGIEFESVSGVPLLALRRFGLTTAQRTVKRAFDVVVAGALLALALPLMAVVAALLRAQGGGPVLFRQVRVGRDGRTFRILKFRTMRAGAEAQRARLHALNASDGVFKAVDDPRVTPLGRMLRRTSADELPQLLNVLRGEMSLVGPRPLVVDEDARVHGWDRRRLHLTPGMTGLWQILSSTRVPLDDMVRMDYRYIASWSLWGDVKLLLRTLEHVLGRHGV